MMRLMRYNLLIISVIFIPINGIDWSKLGTWFKRKKPTITSSVLFPQKYSFRFPGSNTTIVIAQGKLIDAFKEQEDEPNAIVLPIDQTFKGFTQEVQNAQKAGGLELLTILEQARKQKNLTNLEFITTQNSSVLFKNYINFVIQVIQPNLDLLSVLRPKLTYRLHKNFQHILQVAKNNNIKNIAFPAYSGEHQNLYAIVAVGSVVLTLREAQFRSAFNTIYFMTPDAETFKLYYDFWQDELNKKIKKGRSSDFVHKIERSFAERAAKKATQKTLLQKKIKEKKHTKETTQLEQEIIKSPEKKEVNELIEREKIKLDYPEYSKYVSKYAPISPLTPAPIIEPIAIPKREESLEEQEVLSAQKKLPKITEEPYIMPTPSAPPLEEEELYSQPSAPSLEEELFFIEKKPTPHIIETEYIPPFQPPITKSLPPPLQPKKVYHQKPFVQSASAETLQEKLKYLTQTLYELKDVLLR